MVVARKDGTINLIEIASQKTVKAFTEQEVVKDLVKKKNELPADSRSRIIGLEATSTHLLVCTSRGTLSWTPWTASKLMHLSKVPLGHNLDILRSHPISKNVFAVGGKERDLRVYDMNKILEGQQGASMSDPLLPSNIGLLYKAKNLGHDALDLQPKVWIRDIQFMDKADPTKIAVSTQYHQIRMYDFSTQQRRPIMNEEVGDKPILRIRQSHIKDHLLFSDSTNVVGVFSLKDRKVIGAYKGIAGCVQDIKVVQMPAEPGQQGEYVVATGSLDRRLNLHHYPHPEKPFDPKPISRFNMLQRLYCVEVDALDLENVDGPKTTGQQEADHDELWDALGVVEPKRKHVSKKLKK
ncbi:hypothetical protein DM01DRAFT_1340178 [Hesseltinella vesiculosa]|uniref:Ribosome biogenesis protein NSA1 n=1 Tax=Hesseltinella vesiculosa TaxID=101127 RepID=A0A1X2G4W7_9FUNG|nr:hypothetical protein DM01DRAFT_1340178 [Hesseltinella vesiculosa]